MTEKSRILGVGSPIMDILAQVPDDFLKSINGAKGGMEWVSPEEMDAIIQRLPAKAHRAPGGSAANTVGALGRLGASVALLGKMGTDADGEAYKEAFLALGGVADSFKYDPDRPTGRCLSLITPDGERTMRTDLGAAMHIAVEDFLPEDFEACRHVHIEGYGLFNRDYFRCLLKNAQEAGCTISIDLASFEVVRDTMDVLPQLLETYVDMVFANEDEAESFCGSSDPETGLKALSECCPVAAVKLGTDGALLSDRGEVCRVAAVQVPEVVDTTGAGDCWASGFLHGYLNEWSLENCGRFASMVGAETVRCLGAAPGVEGWERIMKLESELRIN